MDRSAKMVLGAMVAVMGFAVGISGPAQALNIQIVNGGFENGLDPSGSPSGWTSTGNSVFSGVQCLGPGPTVFQGNCSYFTGPVGSLGFLSQSFATTVGQPINISLAWLTDGFTPSEFSVELDPGTANFRTLLDSVNHPASVFLTPTLHATAQLPITTLTFNFRNDPGFIFLDAVSATPEPASLALLGVGLAGIWASRRRKTS